MPPETKTKKASKPRTLSAAAKDEAVELLKKHAYSRWSELMNRNGLTDRG